MRRLAPGYEADIVFLRLDSPHFASLRAPLLQMVLARTTLPSIPS
jgi:cytosine/adenosine deaminase-related metal-dependent hydrolase